MAKEIFMKGYLSHILSRAKGAFETPPVKPVVRSWPFIRDAAERLNPFEGNAVSGDITEKEHSTGSKKGFEDRIMLNADMEPQFISSSKTASSRENLPPARPKPSEMPPVYQKIFKPHHTAAETSEPSRIKRKEESYLNVEKAHLEEKSQTIKKRVIKRGEYNQQTIMKAEGSGPLRPKPFKAKRFFKESADTEPQDKMSKKGHKTRERNKRESEGWQQSTSLVKVARVIPPKSKSRETGKRADYRPAVELHPRTPSKTPPFPVSKPKDAGQRLVIGSIKVEVVASPPLKTIKPPEQILYRIVESEPRDDDDPGRFRLLFGLGQM